MGFVNDVRTVVDPIFLRFKEELYGSGISFGRIAATSLPTTVVYTTNITQVIDAEGYLKGITTYSGATLIGTNQKTLKFLGAIITSSGDTTTISVAHKLTNPMIANGDLITQAGGNPSRVAIGTEGYFLGVVGGSPTWVLPPSGTFVDPTSSTGDLIVRSGTLTRIPIGANGQVLTVVSGFPAWQSQFVSPLITQGDIIYALTGGSPTRLGIGSEGYVLAVSGGLPIWKAPSSSTPTGTAGGDLSGTYPNPTVVKLQTVPVANTAPSDGDRLRYNTITSKWEPSNKIWQPLTNGDVDNPELIFTAGNVIMVEV